MKNKKWLIAIPIVLVVIIILIPVACIKTYYPYNYKFKGRSQYEKLQETEEFKNVMNESGFFPEFIPVDAKKINFYAFSGVMQAKPTFTLSFVADEEFFKKEVSKYSCYNVYLYHGGEVSPWCLVEKHYTGEVKTCEELKAEYTPSDNDCEIVMPYNIPKSEYEDICVYVIDDFSFIAYSSKSHRIIYKIDTDYCNGFGDSSLTKKE